MKKIAIIGAGITGLSIAYYLKKANIPFVIFEKSNRVGGVIKTENKNGFLFERGPNTGVISGLELANLLDELKDNLPLKYADEKSKKRLIWKNNRWEALPQGLISGIKTPLFTTRDKLKVATEYFRKKGNYETESLAQTVTRRLGKSFLDYAIDPFVSGVYAGDPEKLITKYAFPKLYNLEDKYGSFIKGSIKLSKIRSKEYKQKVNKKIFSFEKGLQQLPDELYKIIGKEQVKFNQKDLKIHYKGNYKFQIDNECFTHVISTVKPQDLTTIAQFIPFQETKSLQKMKYAKIIHVNIGFNQWKGENLDAFGGLLPTKENKDILGILYMSSQFPERVPSGGALFSVFLGGTKKEYIFDYKDDKIKSIIADHFKTLLNLDKFLPYLFEINRYPSAIAQYGKESKEKLEAIRSIENKFQGFLIKGSIKDGIGISDRITQAYLTTKKIIST